MHILAIHRLTKKLSRLLNQYSIDETIYGVNFVKLKSNAKILSSQAIFPLTTQLQMHA